MAESLHMLKAILEKQEPVFTFASRNSLHFGYQVVMTIKVANK